MIRFILAKVLGTAKKICNPLARVLQDRLQDMQDMQDMIGHDVGHVLSPTYI